MSFFNSLSIKLFSKKIGEDYFGNMFYEDRAVDYLGRNKRYVIYKGLNEPSKVPPLWHAWLYHLSDEIPKEDNKYSWQQTYKPNLTGTSFAFEPSELTNEKMKHESPKINNYNKWQPK